MSDFLLYNLFNRYSLWSKEDLDKLWDTLLTCSVHEKSGTSMSTPLIAGSALIIRQYFMESKYWAELCSKSYKWCKVFEPSGYLLKALILHGGEQVDYLDNSGNSEDVENGLSSSSPSFLPNYFQGYGTFGLHRILPLPKRIGGLPSPLQLIVFDEVIINENTIIKFDIIYENLHSNSPLKITICWFDPTHIAFFEFAGLPIVPGPRLP